VAEQPLAFKLAVSSNKEFVWVCGSEKEKAEWVEAIERCIAVYRESESARLEQLQQQQVGASGTGKVAAEEELSEEDWQLTFTNSETLTFKTRETIISERSTNSVFFRIVKGSVSCQQLLSGDASSENSTGGGGNKSNSGIEKPIGLFQLGVGAVFGFDAFFGRFRPAWSVVANEETTVVCIEISFISRLLRLDAALSVKFYRMLAYSLSQQLKTLESQSFSSILSPPSATVGGSVANLNNNNSPNMGSGASATTAPTDEVSDFRRIFSDLVTDHLLKEYTNVVYNRVLKYTGTLYVTSQHLCFYSKVFGVKKQKQLPLNNISKIEKREGTNSIAITKHKVGEETPALLLVR
jgi:CRP-like cAMP-binding protein